MRPNGPQPLQAGGPSARSSPRRGVPGSATAGARQHAVDPRHLGWGELRLDLTAAGSGSLDGGHGRLVALARLLHLRRQCRVGLLSLGQRPGRPRGRVLGLLQLGQGAEQIGEIVAVHAALRDLAIDDLATPTLPSSSGPRSSTLTISTSAPRSAPSRPTCLRSSSAVRSNAGADGSAGERLPGRGPVPFMPAATDTAALAASASRAAARPCSTPIRPGSGERVPDQPHGRPAGPTAVGTGERQVAVAHEAPSGSTNNP